MTKNKLYDPTHGWLLRFPLKILANFFKNPKKFSELFIAKKRKNILVNLEDLDGIGDTQIKSIEDFFSKNKNSEIIQSLMSVLHIKNFEKLNKIGKLTNKNIMFTGGFEKMSRSEAKALAEENGAKILGSVSKKLDHLVIGNSNYENELKNPVNDARLIASVLDSLSFDVILKENLETDRDFKEAVNEFGKKRLSYEIGFISKNKQRVKLKNFIQW